MLPSFFEPAKAGSIFLDRASYVVDEAQRFRQKMKLCEPHQDSPRILALGIDTQIAFCNPDSSLFVPGSVEDTVRTAKWIYENVGKITKIMFSLDTHTLMQVFHPSSWVDRHGSHPQPFTVITSREVADGKWTPVMNKGKFPDLRAAMVEYCSKLEATGKYALTIWPYHALIGTVGHAVEPVLMEASLFHSAFRRINPKLIIKGLGQFTENFSVFSPEVTKIGNIEVGKFDTELMDEMRKYDKIYVFGQAKSHCVLSSLLDLAEDPQLVKKIYILDDAMSCVPPPPLNPLPESLDFPKVTAKAFEKLRGAGMHIVKTTDPV